MASKVAALSVTKVMDCRNVIQISGEVQNGFVAVTDAPKKLLLLRSNAEIEEIAVASKDDLTCFKGESIGDLLKTMDDEASTTKRISSQRQLKTNVLHLSNSAAHLLAMNDSKGGEHKACFRITSVHCKNRRTEDDVVLSVRITNVSLVTLINDWSLSVSVLPQNSSLTEETDLKIRSQVVPLPNGWKEEQTVTVDISIDKVCAYQVLMFVGRLCLTCDLSEFEIKPEESSNKLKTLHVPLFMKEMNKGEYEELLNAEERTAQNLQRINLAQHKTDTKGQLCNKDRETVKATIFKMRKEIATDSHFDELLLHCQKDLELVTAFGDHVFISLTATDEEEQEVNIRGKESVVIAVRNALGRFNRDPANLDGKDIRKLMNIVEETRKLCDKARQSQSMEGTTRITAEAFELLRTVSLGY